MDSLKHTTYIDESWIRTLANVLYFSRDWHQNLQARFKLHPVVIAAMHMAPSKWQSIVLEWPHQSIDDPKQLAYTRSEEHGENDRQTRTAVGKYLKANFPTMKDNVIRDLVHEHVASCTEGFRFLIDTEEIVEAVKNGPHSCMAWRGSHWRQHPYACYTHELGWSLAIRELEGEIVSRALVYADDDGQVFVRAYGSGSHDDELRGWLASKGVEYVDAWPDGAELAIVERSDGGTMFPYIDGDTQRVDLRGDRLRISSSGDYDCTNQDGTSDSEEEPDDDDSAYCEDCEDHVSDDDITCVGRREDRYVCRCCRNDNYTYVNGSYYVLDEEAVEIEGEQYDENNLPEAFVELKDGSYAFESNAWQCHATDNWYMYSDVDPVIFEEEMYHPDEAPEEAQPDEFAKPYAKPDGSISNEAQLPLAETEADPFAELKAARDAGATIEMRGSDGVWRVIHNPAFNAELHVYRIRIQEEMTA